MRGFSRPLLAWYRRNRRVLPWRETPEPYRVWVSELMLQQTQVTTVLPYFEKFTARFPSVRALAAASRQEVLAAWSGLGYYRRAEGLHTAARWIVEENGGRFPETLEGWLALPGVGRYTAGAILSIAFGKRVPILDGNVARVLARLFAVKGDPRSRETEKKLWELAGAILPRASVSEFNQALMELGALVCTARAPRCLICPIAEKCEARRRGLQERFPETAPRKPTVAVTMSAAVIRRGRKVLMYRRAGRSLMRDLWELPGGTCREGEEPRGALAREAAERYGLRVELRAELLRVRHHIMNQKITLHAFEAEVIHQFVGPDIAGDGAPPPSPGGLRAAHARSGTRCLRYWASHGSAPALGLRLSSATRSGTWVDPKEVALYPMSSMTLKVLRGCAILGG